MAQNISIWSVCIISVITIFAWKQNLARIWKGKDDFDSYKTDLQFLGYGITDAGYEIATYCRTRKHEFPRRQDVINKSHDEVCFKY